ncbi:metallophosphoesterase family protein [Campylobacter suis]|uniref:Calcineurin-like phosphoesterase domain-containing protein n=1 Tax=Campylobacter suis TaxID=2790657 RepID=A0ABN7K984_9BACT|nr:metallophosphoesterase [Campylobacter suis]CAD7289037.1 hypothetical protein LMG8286_01622 [Campylobacter suis]
MKILHATDLHYNAVWFEYLKSVEACFEAICISGDLLDECSDVSLYDQILDIKAWLGKFSKPVFVCSGNHDISLLYEEGWINEMANVYGDDSIITLNGVCFGCVPYVGASLDKFSECDVLLAHVPPYKTPVSRDIKSGRDYGDKSLFSAVDEGAINPKVLLCGHIHEPKANVCKLKNTTIYNPGCEFGKSTPKICEVVV